MRTLGTLFLIIAALSSMVESHIRCNVKNTTAPPPMLMAKIKAGIAATLNQAGSLMAAVASSKAKILTIPVFWHILVGDKNLGYVNRSVVVENNKLLNRFVGRNIGLNFKLKQIKYYNSPNNASFNASNNWGEGFRIHTRQGTAAALNIWVAPDLDGALGWASFPWDRQFAREDGVNILTSSMMGAFPSEPNFDLGLTLIHEVGHWLGLTHTFEGGCDRVGLGELQVDDLPPQRSPSSGCPIRRNSCPNQVGFDPIHNFMDYSYDSCYEDFSLGQFALMRQNYVSVRLNSW